MDTPKILSIIQIVCSISILLMLMPIAYYKFRIYLYNRKIKKLDGVYEMQVK
jgi:hypothetical protein